MTAIPKGFEKRVHQLRPMAIQGCFEDEAKSLFEEICCGSRSLWPLEPDSLKAQDDLRTKFYLLAHEGMWAAQERFLRRIESSSPLLVSEEALYRTAMDTIAWQMLGRQLCYARRLYREKRQPSLTDSNLQSVIGAARYFREQKPNSMPLISDLTTFVQIGDILAFDPEVGMSIMEVKEGEKNHEICGLATFYRQSGCEHFKQIVSETETAHTVKQFERVLRQMDRMDFATTVISKGKGIDPDSNQEIRIPEPYIPMEDWDTELNKTFDDALDRGWALTVIDDCLFVGVYASEQMRAASPFVFLAWLDQFGGGESSPVARLIDCVNMPLALPVFAIPTSPERMIDVLFGRIHVCMGISIPCFVKACEKHGITVRGPKNKSERKTIQSLRGEAIKYKGQSIVLERNGKMMIPASGIFVRSLFHFQRPISVISAMLDNS
ncbi:MAG: hypothetical protein ACM3SV_09315 [Betaproteobacteria bacterium]